MYPAGSWNCTWDQSIGGQVCYHWANWLPFNTREKNTACNIATFCHKSMRLAYLHGVRMSSPCEADSGISRYSAVRKIILHPQKVKLLSTTAQHHSSNDKILIPHIPGVFKTATILECFLNYRLLIYGACTWQTILNLHAKTVTNMPDKISQHCHNFFERLTMARKLNSF